MVFKKIIPELELAVGHMEVVCILTWQQSSQSTDRAYHKYHPEPVDSTAGLLLMSVAIYQTK